MQYATIYHAGHRIEIRNASRGKETILVDGVEVSSRRAIKGNVHTFSLSTGERRIPCEVQFNPGTHAMGVSMAFIADGQPVVEILPGRYVFKKRDFIILLVAGVVMGLLAFLVSNLAQ